ncbi:uncharacterized protein LOC129728083 [Wyeomyia smithii]|uniref:uncharacterized protein LOC129728083 n=1 Tax=Wyeomyia smithii TaxID=174621 RepID=UPI002467B31D|nr:uncharacterized protein LOC129728083 [Wyeomyia smithii]
MRTKAAFVLVILSFLAGSTYTQQQENIAPVPEWIVFYHQTKVNIQVLEPRGIQFWIKRKPNILGFGVELIINPTYESGAGCDLCRNVSSPIDGKYFVQDDNVLVRIGDTIQYRGLEVESHEAKWSEWRTVFVDKSLFTQAREHCSGECNRQKGYAKVRFLEGYIEKMLANCEIEELSENLFFPLDHANHLVSDPVKFVKTRLYTVESLRPLVDNVKNVYVAQDGVGFSMETILEKLKVLEVGRDRLKLLDYDEYLIVPRASDTK